MDNISSSQKDKWSPDEHSSLKEEGKLDQSDEEEIAEDLPQDDLEASGDKLQSVAKIGESHGITVS